MKYQGPVWAGVYVEDHLRLARFIGKRSAIGILLYLTMQ